MFRLAHGWTLTCGPGVSAALVRWYIRAPVRAAPSSLARRLGPCRISLVPELEPGAVSQWTAARSGLRISVAITGLQDHDIAMELLLCLGQALWERLSDAELRAWWMLLRDEIDRGVGGEIDEQAGEEKHELLESPEHAGSSTRLARYARASFAGTAAEYIHCLWHDVTVRTGPECLPAPALRRRLELMARWLPPDRGYRLFARTSPPASAG